MIKKEVTIALGVALGIVGTYYLVTWLSRPMVKAISANWNSATSIIEADGKTYNLSENVSVPLSGGFSVVMDTDGIWLNKNDKHDKLILQKPSS